jgi:hypothetical protein
MLEGRRLEFGDGILKDMGLFVQQPPSALSALWYEGGQEGKVRMYCVEVPELRGRVPQEHWSGGKACRSS